MIAKNMRDNPLYKYAKDFADICNPLLINTPINYFSISRYYYDNHYTAFQNNPSWAEHYLPRHFDETMLNVNKYHAHSIKGDFALWTLSSVFSQDKATEELYKSLVAFNYSNGITLIQKCEEYAELYWFASPKIDGIDHFFIEKLEFLKSFIYLVLEKIHSHKELCEAYYHRYKIPLAQAPEDNKKLEENILLNNFPQPSRYYIPHLKKNVYFTEQEYKVICLMKKGFTAKQIAKTLNISPRTTEHYIEAIKIKSGCVTKMDLVYAINKINLL